MERFRTVIKENVLMLGGTTYGAYYKRRTTNADGYDPVDGVIFKAARKLDRRYFKIFGLLYECHDLKETRQRLDQRGHKGIGSDSTIDRYRAYVENRIIELLESSPDLMKDLRAAVDK